MKTIDKRINNGGNSTKAKKPIDFRKKEFRNIPMEVLNPEQLGEVINMLYVKAVNKQDTASAKILLEIYLGKPRQMIEQHHQMQSDFNIKEMVRFKD